MGKGRSPMAAAPDSGGWVLVGTPRLGVGVREWGVGR